MSLILAHVGEDSIHVVTDTVMLGVNGTVAGFTSKVYAVPHANLVIACRGHVCALPMAAASLQMVGSTFDEIAAKAADVLRPFFIDVTDPALRAYIDEAGGNHDVEVTLAGISEKRGPMVCSMTVVETGGPREWAIEECCGVDELLGPFTEEIAREFEEHVESRHSNRLTELLWLAERSRLIRSPVFGRGEPVCQIGGAAVLTTITARTIEHRLLRRWPDKLGSLIEPDL